MEYVPPERKLSEYLFQTIEKMAKSDEEYEVELCSTPTSSKWQEVPTRRRWQRRCINRAPPPPPSTPTSLTASNTPTPSPTTASPPIISTDDERLSSLLYILDYAPKYKKKLKEQQRTDTELAELFNVFTITGGSAVNGSRGIGSGSGGGSGSGNINGTGGRSSSRERGISAASRTIRRHDSSVKIFKIHRNPKEFFRDLDEEDSVSAPEYDNEEESAGIRYRRFSQHLKCSRRLQLSKRQRRFARFEHQERMDSMLDTFDAAMNFNGA